MPGKLAMLNSTSERYRSSMHIEIGRVLHEAGSREENAKIMYMLRIVGHSTGMLVAMAKGSRRKVGVGGKSLEFNPVVMVRRL